MRSTSDNNHTTAAVFPPGTKTDVLVRFSSVVGERSKGVLDAGATSCWLILRTMADSVTKRL